MAAEVDGVILAAGCSRRAGTFKMTADIGSKPLLLWGLDQMAAQCGRVIVVAGFEAEKIRALVAGRSEVDLVINENFTAGMLSSVQAGAARVRAPRFFLVPGDLPLVKATVYQKLLAANAGIAIPECRGRRGHPVLLDSSLIRVLLAEPLTSSLGRFIARHGSVSVEVDDPGILADLDDANDMKKINALLGAGGKNE